MIAFGRRSMSFRSSFVSHFVRHRQKTDWKVKKARCRSLFFLFPLCFLSFRPLRHSLAAKLAPNARIERKNNSPRLPPQLPRLRTAGREDECSGNDRFVLNFRRWKLRIRLSAPEIALFSIQNAVADAESRILLGRINRILWFFLLPKSTASAVERLLRTSVLLRHEKCNAMGLRNEEYKSSPAWAPQMKIWQHMPANDSHGS